MKREVNMRPIPPSNEERKNRKVTVVQKLDEEVKGTINTDPLGMYTGVPTGTVEPEQPVQDVDDL